MGKSVPHYRDDPDLDNRHTIGSWPGSGDYDVAGGLRLCAAIHTSM